MSNSIYFGGKKKVIAYMAQNITSVACLCPTINENFLKFDNIFEKIKGDSK